MECDFNHIVTESFPDSNVKIYSSSQTVFYLKLLLVFLFFKPMLRHLYPLNYCCVFQVPRNLQRCPVGPAVPPVVPPQLTETPAVT